MIFKSIFSNILKSKLTLTFINYFQRAQIPIKSTQLNLLTILTILIFSSKMIKILQQHSTLYFFSQINKHLQRKAFHKLRVNDN